MSELGPGLVEVVVEATCVCSWELAPGSMPGGHAVVGVVASAGEGADHQVGSRVLVGRVQGCGECDICRRGQMSCCPDAICLTVNAPGGLAGRVQSRARYTTSLTDALTVEGPIAAIIAGDAADAYALTARVGLGPGDRVTICGDGPVAALLHQLIAVRGAHLAAPGVHVAKVCFATGPGPELSQALAAAGPGTVVAALMVNSAPDSGQGAAEFLRLAELGGTFVGVPGAHPDLYPEVAAMVIKGDLDIASVATTWPCPGPVNDHLTSIGEQAEKAELNHRRLVIELAP